MMVFEEIGLDLLDYLSDIRLDPFSLLSKVLFMDCPEIGAVENQEGIDIRICECFEAGRIHLEMLFLSPTDRKVKVRIAFDHILSTILPHILSVIKDQLERHLCGGELP
jgi:hypothetical protein